MGQELVERQSHDLGRPAPSRAFPRWPTRALIHELCRTTWVTATPCTSPITPALPGIGLRVCGGSCRLKLIAFVAFVARGITGRLKVCRAGKTHPDMIVPDIEEGARWTGLERPDRPHHFCHGSTIPSVCARMRFPTLGKLRRRQNLPATPAALPLSHRLIVEPVFAGGPGKLQAERSDFSAYGFAIGTDEDRVLAWLALAPTLDLAVRGAGRARHPSQHGEAQ